MPSSPIRESPSRTSGCESSRATTSSLRPCYGARAKLRRFVCRLDVCWTAAFFLFLICVASLTTVVTQRIIDPRLLSTWHTLHYLRVAAANTRIGQGTDIVDRMAAAFTDVHLLQPLRMGTEDTLALVCSTLAAYDTDMIVRAFVPMSVEEGEMIGCIHGAEDTGSLRTLTGFISLNHRLVGSFLVNSTTMRFARPLRQVTEAPPDRRNVTYIIEKLVEIKPFIEMGEAFYNGSIATYDKRVKWLSPPSMPHLIYYHLPVSIPARGLTLNRSLTDFVQVRIDGSRILLGNTFRRTPGLSIAAFIPESLDSADPKLMATSWGQDAVSNNSIYQSTAYSGAVYLTTSGITDPLMRAALKHVDLSELQRDDCNTTLDFQFRGGCATVTLVTLTTHTGCVLRLVYASSHVALVGSYRWTVNGCNGALAAAIVLFTGLFWCFINRQFSQPLTQMTKLMLHNVETGARTRFVTRSATWLRLKEVYQLIRAHNRTMRRLQQIELFIPAAIRRYFNRPLAQTRYLLTDTSEYASSATELRPAPFCHFTTQTQSVVYIMLRPTPKLCIPHISLTQLLRSKGRSEPEDTTTTTTPFSTPVTASAAEASAASAVPTVNSGPFDSPADLEAFAEAVYELSADHHGVVYRLSPDSCVVHFGKTARAVGSDCATRTAAATTSTPNDAEEMEVRTVQSLEGGIRRDARDAMAFVWSLQKTLQHPESFIDVDMRVLVDTTAFVCGQYRGAKSEHVLSVVMGRDVQRDLGPLLPSLKVRVAMTEETARRLRAEWIGTFEPGVRQLPIEAISTDRAGSSTNVVLLYEALPGPVAGDMVWQRYAQHCFEGFSCMLHGDYTAALQAFSCICDIADLEPGLLPMCLEREAAVSFVSGGAVSVQVDRLMRECRRCVSLHITRAYCRTRRLPPGMGVATDEMKQRGASPLRSGSKAASCRPSPSPPQEQPPKHHSPRTVSGVRAAPHSGPRHVHFEAKLTNIVDTHQRYLISLSTSNQVTRHVLGDPPKSFRDVFRQTWSLSRLFRTVRAPHPSNVYVTVLHSSGAFGLASQLILRQVPRIVTKAVKEAPDGFLSDALRSAVPVCDPSDTQRAQLRVVVNTFCSFDHPNLILPQSYSPNAVEGAVILIWPYFSGCSLRQLLQRHPRIVPAYAARFLLPVLTALAYLHRQNAAHGELSLDTVIVAADGSCRLLTRCAASADVRALFSLPHTCYVSPAMAAGALPSPACDIFCYGLMCIEIMSRGKVWKWAPVFKGHTQQLQQQHRTAEELKTLVADGGRLFREAVATGVLLPDTDVLDAVTSGNLFRELTTATLRTCLSLDPSKRPTANEVCNVTKLFLKGDTTEAKRGEN